jgi:DNA mismatch repair protein MutL
MSVRILPDSVVSKIAAGEVIERPASVVKELVENSIDAGADDIEIEVKNGGRRLIRVSDNGSGMSESDLLLSVKRHATSKIYDEKDLFSISTLGFRGEALFSIASVSKLRIITRTKESISGRVIYLEGGNLLEARETGSPVGTSVEVMEIFYNYPVRLNFIKSSSRELEQIIGVINRLSLSNHNIRFKLINNKDVLLSLERVSNPIDRIAELFGKNVYENLYDISRCESSIDIKGFISKPDFNRSTQRDIYLYINGRYVRDRVINHAILEGYKNIIDKDRFPIAILFIKIPPDIIDVNVHPTKIEVRFKDANIIHELIYKMVKERISIPYYRPIHPYEDRVMDAMLRYSISNANRGRDLKQELEYRRESQKYKVSSTLFKEGRFSSLNIIGQLWNTYIICESNDSMVIIDQHAAHERIIFERLKKDSRIVKKPLLIPKTFELNHKDSEILKESIDYLRNIGLEVESFGKNSFVIKSVPYVLEYGDWEVIILDIIEELSSFDRASKFDDIRNKIISRIACHKSIKAHYKEEYPSIKSLLKDMDGLGSLFCPHGRPIEIRLSKNDIEKMFKRR